MTDRRTVNASYAPRKLRASRANLMFGTALGVSIAIFAASPQHAWAADECGADVGGVAVCTDVGNPYPTGIDYTGDAGEDITVVLLGGGLAANVVTATDDGVTATGTATFDAEVYTYAGATIDAALNGIEVDSSGVGGDSNVINGGTISAGLSGIDSYSFGGASTVSNTGAITATGAAAGSAFGIHSNGLSSTVSNSGVITVNEATGAQAEGIYSYGYAGDSIIANSADVTVTSTVGVAGGLVGITGGFGGSYDVVIANSADITTNGVTLSDAVYADSSGNAVVAITGDLDATASAGGARGVDVTAYYDAVVAMTGDITVAGTSSAYGIEIDTNMFDATSDATVAISGNINATATTGFGEGVDVYAGGDVTIGVDGDITASSGAGAYGVFAVSYYGDVEVNTLGVDVTAVAGGAGIDVFAGGFDGAGDATVTAGDINVTGTGVEGVDADAIYGSVSIDVGAVTTSGAGSEGIDIYAYNDVTVTAGPISTAGTGSDGVHSYALLGNTDIAVGDVTTTGDDSYGIYAYSFLGSTEVVAEDVNTSGAGSVGIYAYGFGTASVDAVSVTTSGDGATGVDAFGFAGTTVETDLVVTSGNSSTGIIAVSPTDYVLVNSGTVNTTGDASDGIQAASLGADDTDYVTVNSDVITTDGLGSDGIVAYANGGDITIDSGSIATLGDDSFGIYAYANLGDNDITSDSVTTAGAGSVGIYAYSFFGYTTVDSGTVATSGDGATGIYAYGYTGANVTSDSVTTAGVGADGIDAISFFNTVAVDSGTVATTGDDSIGILAHGTGGTTVTSDVVTTDGTGSEGIVALDVYGPTTVTSGSVTTLGDSSNGIRAGSYYDVTVDSGTVETSGMSSMGIYAYSLGTTLGTGDVSVDFDSVITHGDSIATGVVPSGNYNLYYYDVSSHGVVAVAATGASSVTGGDVTTYGDGAYGVLASGFGDTYVNVDDVTTHGDALINYTYTGPGTPFTDYYRGAIGISASVTGGDVTVIADTVTTYGYEASGIVAVGNAYYDSVATTYSGDTLVSVNSVETHGDFADGIVAANYGGNSSVFVNSVETFGEGADGIIAAAIGYYDSANIQTIYGDAYVSALFVTTHGDDAFGIYAAASAGDVHVNAYSVHTYGDGATGIYAAAFNYYDSSTGAEQNLHGDVEVDAQFVSTNGDFADAISAYAEGGNIDINVFSVVTQGDFSNGITAYAAYYGPDPVLLTYYSGDVRIEADSVFTLGDFSDGINAYAGGGNVSIYAGNVLAYGIGSDAIYAGTGGLDVNNTDNVFVETTGLIYAYDGVGISVNSAGYSDIYVDSGSVYGYNWGIQSNSANGTYIYNDGSISGGFGAAIDVDGGAAEIANYGQIYGYMDLTDNNDYVYNADLWEAYGYSNFGLGVDVVVNVDTVGFGRDGLANSYTRFAGLEYFDNYAVVSGVDGEVGDYLYIDGEFYGGAGSELDLDVELGGPGSGADVLFVGLASGETEIVPNDVLAGSPGALNFGGILVVDSASNETGDEFTMANVDKGFVEYSLLFDAASDSWSIVGLPDDEVFELLGAMSSSQDFWKRSGDAMSARWQELRDEGGSAGMSAGPGGVGRSDGWELWMQAHGGKESFDNAESFAINGFTFAQDLTADSDWRGFQFGFDNLQGDVLWGLTMGFTQQETKFDFDSNSFDTEGWNIGGYFGWASNGFFLNALLKGDFYEQDANFHTLPSIFTFDGITWGAQGELGYRWEGDGWFFEPLAALAWNTTDLDDVSTSGASIEFDDATSFRGKAGARIGGTYGAGDVVWTPYIGAYYVDEWEGDNQLTFTTGPTSITFSDQGRGSYGLVDFGATFQSFYGLEGFVKGEWNFGGDADGGAVRLGARWRW